jgi:hypothetical protein
VDRRRIGGTCFALTLIACGADVVAREPAPESALELGSAVVAAAETDANRIRAPWVDCNEVEQVGYRKGKRFPIRVVTIDGAPVEERTANAYWAMRSAAANEGIELVIYSGFRTQEEQEYFYRCYRECSCNGCSPAAKPGRSNHQTGYALDIGMYPGVHEWLVGNAERFGFRATVEREPWHWEYRPGKRTPKAPELCPDAPKARR